MEETHVLDQPLPPSVQKMSSLDHHDLEKTGTAELSSVNVNASIISAPIPEKVLQADQELPSLIEIHASDYDLEKSGTGHSMNASISIGIPETEILDIEHVPVQDDPREWSSFRKVSFPIQSSVSFSLPAFPQYYRMLLWH